MKLYIQSNSAELPYLDKMSAPIENSVQLSFLHYLRYNKFNRIAIPVFLILITLEFIIFKYFYPFAGFINGDSYAYILSGFYNLRADTYPIGYPKFLRLVSVFSYSDTFLTLVQFSILELSMLFFLFTLFYFYRPQYWIRVSLLIIIVLNPVFPFITNYVSSDSLFITLSLLWFTSMLWFVHIQSLGIILMHSTFIFLSFIVRYNALFYPLIAIITLLMSVNTLRNKIIGSVFTILLIGLFVNYTANQFKRISGTRQFSPFSGWQIANNAMYAYRFVDSTDRKQLQPKFTELDNDVRTYFDTTKDYRRHPQELLYASTIYMWDPISPLKIYMNRKYKQDSTQVELQPWSKVAPLYSDYGKEIISQYPGTFIKYFIWPNFLKFYVPPVEFLGSYSTGVDTVPITAKQWFWYKDYKLKYRVKDMKVNLFNYYPILSGVINALFLAISIAFLILKPWSNYSKLFFTWAIFASFWLLNLSFSVFASPIALRFQLFPNILNLAVIMLLLDYILKQGRLESNLEAAV